MNANKSFSWSNSILDLYTHSHEIIRSLSDTSMNPMLSWIVLFLFRDHWGLSGSTLIFLFINSHSLPTEHTSLWTLNLFSHMRFLHWWFLIIQRWRKVHIHISINDTNGIVWRLWINFQNVNIKLVVKCGNRDGITLMQTCKVSQLILQDSLGVVQFDEFCSVRSKFDHVVCLHALLFKVWDKSYGSWWTFFREFEHLKHPVGNVAYA